MMDKTVKVWCENTSTQIIVKIGTSLEELLGILHLEEREQIISAYVNNRSKDLNYIIYTPLTVRYIDRSHFEGARVYARTMCFVLFKAVKDLFPTHKLFIKQSIKQGYYFDIEQIETSQDSAKKIKERMEYIIQAQLPISREKAHYSEAAQLFCNEGLDDKLELLDSRRHLYVTINRMANVCGYFYGTLAASTSYLNIFDIIPLEQGFYMALPKRSNPNELDLMYKCDKMFGVFSKHKRWNSIIDISTIGKLNCIIEQEGGSDLIKVGEALQAKEFSHLGDLVLEAKNNGVQLVLISGPSSSGKTSFSKRLMIQLRVMGLRPVAISIDDYFVNRNETPLDEKGRPDYESLGAVDTKQFNEDINHLMQGEEVIIPRFDFQSGSRIEGKPLRLPKNSILIVEGIHALNPELTNHIEEGKKYKIYASALTSISMDNLSRIGTTDNRLLRRMVRDNKYRNRSALDTIRVWGAVRRGEERNIFPYQEEADYMFNTALFFEFSVLKKYAEPLLKSVPDTEIEYSEARRLMDILDYVSPIDESEIPPTSIIREFIGGSSFEY